jgi:hypothetical protein
MLDCPASQLDVVRSIAKDVEVDQESKIGVGFFDDWNVCDDAKVDLAAVQFEYVGLCFRQPHSPLLTSRYKQEEIYLARFAGRSSPSAAASAW